MSENRVKSALCHPLVLRGAWLRIDAWYRSGSLAPQPELELWRLHPEAELRKLRAELKAGAWRPAVVLSCGPRRRSHERELARLLGRPLFLLADVNIPVKGMIEAQREGVEKAAKRAMGQWLKTENPPPEFKAPPPGYKRKVDRA